jgi:hypothetical protein
MDDEEKIVWILAYAAKAARGEISPDCASFADKARECYVARFSVDLGKSANEDQ